MKVPSGANFEMRPMLGGAVPGAPRLVEELRAVGLGDEDAPVWRDLHIARLR